MNIINKIAVLLFVIVGGLILSPMASATPAQGTIPSIMYPNTPTVGIISGGSNTPHIADEIAVWDATAVPIYGVGCPLPPSSGGKKWELKADVNNDGNFGTKVGYTIPNLGDTINIADFGDGGTVLITTTGGATIDPAISVGGYQWVDVDTGFAGTDSNLDPGLYEFASCGEEGTAMLPFVGTTTFYVIVPSTSLTKDTSSSKVHVGDEVTYTYYETNDGTLGSNLADPYVEDDMCSSVVYSSGDVNTNDKLDVDETWIYTCSMILNTPGQVTNTAIGHGIDPLGNDVTYPDYAVNGIFEDLDEIATATVTVIDPRISLEKTVDEDKVRPGDEVTYTYVVRNTGDSVLTDVTVTDDQVIDPIGSILSLSPNDEETFYYTTVINGETTNIATATGTDQLGQDVTADDTVTVRVFNPAISLDKTVDEDKVRPGDEVTYTYVVRNIGESVLTDVTVTDDQVIDPIGSIPSLALGGEETFYYTTVISGETTNIATATGTDQSGQDVTAEDTVTVRVFNPGITVEKTCTPETQPAPGTIDWQITVTNTGDVELDVVVTDSSWQGQAEVFNGPILAGETRTIPLQDSGLPDGVYINSVTAVGTHQLGWVTAESGATCEVLVVGTEGCTPGYWKNHLDSWQGFEPQQTLGDVFGFTDYGLHDKTLIEGLELKGGKGVEGAAEILLRIAVASLLNAAHPDVGYTMSTAEVISSVNTALASNDRETMLALKDQLDFDNNLGCPLD